MIWIEMIRIRSCAGSLTQVKPSLADEINVIRAMPDTVDAFLFQHALYDGDLAAVVLWKASRSPAKTMEGLLLAEQLQRFGPIDHAVWIPAPGFEGPMHKDTDKETRRKLEC